MNLQETEFVDPVTTPGPIHDVAELIFLRLDKKTLMACRLVSKEWKKFVNRPTFWFKKLSFKYADVEEEWNSLAKVVKEKDEIDEEVEDHFVLPLMKMYSGTERSPLEIVWNFEKSKEKSDKKYQDLILSNFILEHIEQEAKHFDYNSMCLAAKFGKTEVVKKIIANNDKYDLDAVAGTEDGSINSTPILIAAEHGHLDIIKYLVHHSAKPITRDHEGWTAIHWAAKKGKKIIV